jgi:hypothetical protein
MTSTFATYTKTSINAAVALVNAPRRSAAYNVGDAWDAVLAASAPTELVKNAQLGEASAEVRQETERCAHTPPKFSADGTIALLTIRSAAQIHPVIATRWAGHLKSAKIEVVMCANEGYLPGQVNFSCRVARAAKVREGAEKVDIIRKLEALVDGDKGLRERLGESYARGHTEASGGIVGEKEWEEVKGLMGIGEAEKKKAQAKEKGGQKNTLANYFVKKPEKT